MGASLGTVLCIVGTELEPGLEPVIEPDIELVTEPGTEVGTAPLDTPLLIRAVGRELGVLSKLGELSTDKFILVCVDLMMLGSVLVPTYLALALALVSNCTPFPSTLCFIDSIL